MGKRSGDSQAERQALVLSPEAPFPPVGGGPLRTASLIEYLGSSYAVDLVVFREPGAADPRQAVPRGFAGKLQVIELPYHSKGPLARAGRNAWRLARGAVPLNDRFAGFDRQIEALVAGSRYDLAVVEHFWCAPYLKALPAAETILDLHNIESELLEGCARAEGGLMGAALRRFARACRRAERQWLPRYGRLLVASEEDRARALEIAPGAAVTVYPNAIPWRPRPERAERPEIAFSGNLEYEPNVSAVRFFAGEVWPRLAARYPGLAWRIIGKNPQAVARYVEGGTGIVLSGEVQDAVEELAAAKVVVVPLLAGSGTRFKIVEAWAAGRAVVSTTLGAEGLPGRDGEHLALADSGEAFARTVGRLLDSAEERARLGAAGRTLYEARLTWEQAWKALKKAGI